MLDNNNTVVSVYGVSGLTEPTMFSINKREESHICTETQLQTLPSTSHNRECLWHYGIPVLDSCLPHREFCWKCSEYCSSLRGPTQLPDINRCCISRKSQVHHTKPGWCHYANWWGSTWRLEGNERGWKQLGHFRQAYPFCQNTSCYCGQECPERLFPNTGGFCSLAKLCCFTWTAWWALA